MNEVISQNWMILFLAIVGLITLFYLVYIIFLVFSNSDILRGNYRYLKANKFREKNQSERSGQKFEIAKGSEA